MIENHADLIEFINKTEGSYFRTHSDTGANTNSLFIWNQVRAAAGLEKITQVDLMRRARDIYVADREKALDNHNFGAARQAQNTIDEFEEVLNAENPHRALAEYREKFRALQGARS